MIMRDFYAREPSTEMPISLARCGSAKCALIAKGGGKPFSTTTETRAGVRVEDQTPQISLYEEMEPVGVESDASRKDQTDV